MVPILDSAIRNRLTQEVLGIMLADNTKAWELTSEGRYERVQLRPGETPVRSQTKFTELAREKVREFEATTGRLQVARAARFSNPLMGQDDRRPRKKKRQESSPGGKWRM